MWLGSHALLWMNQSFCRSPRKREEDEPRASGLVAVVGGAEPADIQAGVRSGAQQERGVIHACPGGRSLSPAHRLSSQAPAPIELSGVCRVPNLGTRRKPISAQLHLPAPASLLVEKEGVVSGHHAWQIALWH